jgi:acyl dehydratase
MGGMNLEPSSGLYFEDFQIGQVGRSATRTISDGDVMLFAGLSGDFNEIHTSETFAAKSFFGRRVAHGLLGLSIASGLAVQMGFMRTTVEMFRSLEWEFTAPIYLGDTVQVQAEVAELKAFPRLKNGRVTFKITLHNQKDEVVQRGSWSILIKSKPTQA